MSTKKPKLQNNPLSWVETKKVEIQGIRLSDVQYVSPLKLKPNPFNQDFFREESAEYFRNLRKDIQERGIIVPLISKRDDTLLAGHNRLRLAQELGFENIPVQYVLDVLPKNAEQEFIIKDNLFRRQFSSAEWIALYKKLYPNFDDQIQQETRGGGLKWSKTERSVLLEQEEIANRLTADKIAQDTGQKISAVQKQLSKYRKEIKETKEQTTKKQSTNTTKESTNKNVVNAALVEETSETFGKLESTLKKENEKTIRMVLKRIDSFKAKLERLL